MRKRLNKVKIEWSPKFAYSIGLITSDGNLSSSGRHINLTSKDYELVSIFKKCLELNNKIGRKSRGGSKEKKYFVIQFGDVSFYDFLLSIGLMQKKSKIIKRIDIPAEFFPDFLRGCIDGDGNISISVHPESKHKQLKVRLSSASLHFCKWIIEKMRKLIKCEGGWIYTPKNKSIHTVTFAKTDSIKIIKYMYYNGVQYYLKRKYALVKEYTAGVA